MAVVRAALAVVILTTLAFALIQREASERTFREELYVFGSIATIELLHADEAQARASVAAVARQWQTFHRDWHPWEEGALTRLNTALGNGQRSDPLPASLLELIALGQTYESESRGLVNPALGRLVGMWGFHTSNFPVKGAAPSTEAVTQLMAQRPSMQDVQRIHDRASSSNPAVQLDFSAIAEGLALHHAATMLRARGVRNALLSMGGDVVAIGRNGERAWRVAIRDPDGAVLADVELADGEALFSSGTYSRFREDPDGRRPHLIDPRDGSPLPGVRASAVLHSDPVRADAAATALAIGGVDAFARLQQEMKVGCALLIGPEDRLLVTPGMAARLRLADEARRAELLGAQQPCDR